jgi:hypothetical protein
MWWEYLLVAPVLGLALWILARSLLPRRSSPCGRCGCAPTPFAGLRLQK